MSYIMVQDTYVFIKCIVHKNNIIIQKGVCNIIHNMYGHTYIYTCYMYIIFISVVFPSTLAAAVVTGGPEL